LVVLVGKKKVKAIPVTGRAGPKAFETSRLPYFLDTRHTDGGEVFDLPGRFLVLISVRAWADLKAIVRLEGVGKLGEEKKTMSSSGLEPATFRIVA
jgi:hypothetical protein